MISCSYSLTSNLHDTKASKPKFDHNLCRNQLDIQSGLTSGKQKSKVGHNIQRSIDFQLILNFLENEQSAQVVLVIVGCALWIKMVLIQNLYQIFYSKIEQNLWNILDTSLEEKSNRIKRTHCQPSAEHPGWQQWQHFVCLEWQSLGLNKQTNKRESYNSFWFSWHCRAFKFEWKNMSWKTTKIHNINHFVNWLR